MLTSFLSYKGRIGRGAWWLTALVQGLLLVGAGLYIMNVDAAENPRTGWQGPVFFAILLLIAWIGICGNIKRYHDRGKSGFWVFISFVPIVGPIWMTIELGMLPGTEGANDFGPAPGSTASYHSPDSAETGTKLGKLDDAYFQEYAAKLAAQNNTAAAAAQTVVGARATFGKRA